MLYLPDVNVWIALTATAHTHHWVAREWLEGRPQHAKLAFCRITQLSLLRLLTTRAVMRSEVLTPARAWMVMDEWLADDRVEFLAEPDGIEQALRAATTRPKTKSGDWTDAYLAAFSGLSGYTLVTADKALAGGNRNSVLLAL